MPFEPSLRLVSSDPSIFHGLIGHPLSEPLQQRDFAISGQAARGKRRLIVNRAAYHKTARRSFDATIPGGTTRSVGSTH